MNQEILADLLGQMATVGTTRMPLGMCPSCARALIYGALMWAGAVINGLDDAETALAAGDVALAHDEVSKAHERQSELARVLVQFVHADFDSSMPAGTELDDEGREEAIRAFLHSRMGTYVAADGQILLEPHEERE